MTQGIQHSAKEIRVIETVIVLPGDAVNPARTVVQYWTVSGNLLFERIQEGPKPPEEPRVKVEPTEATPADQEDNGEDEEET